MYERKQKQSADLELEQKAKPKKEAARDEENGSLDRDRINISDACSVASSVASLQTSANSLSNSQQIDLFAQELQIAVASKETPPLIKKLGMVLVGFLAVVMTLIAVESAKFFQETDDLMDRFQMIEFFQIRYELIVYLSVSPRSYDTYRRASSASTFVSYCYRTRVRADRASAYNLKVRLSFNKFGLDYDYQSMAITYGSSVYYVSSDYAFLKVNRAL